MYILARTHTHRHTHIHTPVSVRAPVARKVGCDLDMVPVEAAIECPREAEVSRLASSWFRKAKEGCQLLTERASAEVFVCGWVVCVCVRQSARER